MVKKSKSSMTIFGKTFPSYVFVVGIILVASLAFVGYNLVANELDRRKFVEIEETVNTLVDRINEEFGTKVVADNSRCYKASRKLEAEPTVCVFEKEISIVSSEFDKAALFIKEQADTVANIEQPFANYIFYPVEDNYSCRFEDELGSITIGCSSQARANYYLFSD